jgi:hypothetical protein
VAQPKLGGLFRPPRVDEGNMTNRRDERGCPRNV